MQLKALDGHSARGSPGALRAGWGWGGGWGVGVGVGVVGVGGVGGVVRVLGGVWVGVGGGLGAEDAGWHLCRDMVGPQFGEEVLTCMTWLGHLKHRLWLPS